MYMLIYVDDIIISGNNKENKESINKLKELLNTKFHIEHLRKSKYFLGLELSYIPQGIHINQRKYVIDLIKEYGLTEAKPSGVPIDKNTKFGNDDSKAITNPTLYRRLIGKLVSLTITKVDITYTVNFQEFIDIMEVKKTIYSLDSRDHLQKSIEQLPMLLVKWLLFRI